MPGRSASTTRRGALGGVIGLVVLSACDVDDLRPPEDEPTSSTGPSPSPGPSTATDPDTTLVNRVVTDIVGASVVVEGARLLPRLRRALGPLDRMHLAHLEALDSEPEGPLPHAPPSVAAGLRRVRTAENALQQSLATAAVEAQSGALARLLASMSASVSQHLVDLRLT